MGMWRNWLSSGRTRHFADGSFKARFEAASKSTGSSTGSRFKPSSGFIEGGLSSAELLQVAAGRIEQGFLAAKAFSKNAHLAQQFRLLLLE